MGNSFTPPFGLPSRPGLDTPDRGYSTYTCDVPDSEKLPHQLYPWIFLPPGFESFDLTGSIATPTTTAQATVLELAVPEGWDGIVNKIANVFIGTGFIEASGDLVWQILYNSNQPVKNYGAITTTFGSVAQPRDISGFIVRSKQTIQYRVTNTVAPTLSGGSYIYCTLSGYFWRSQGGTY